MAIADPETLFSGTVNAAQLITRSNAEYVQNFVFFVRYGNSVPFSVLDYNRPIDDRTLFAVPIPIPAKGDEVRPATKAIIARKY